MTSQAEARVRMDAAERRRLLVDAAQRAFATSGYSSVGLAQIAADAQVSKTLLYHYFPGGRPELYREVTNRLANELQGALKGALRMPLAPERRVKAAVEIFFAFLSDKPDAYRLLFLDPWGSGDSEIVGQAMALRVHIGTELTKLLATAGAPASVAVAGSTASLGVLLHVAENWLAGQIDHDEAVDVASKYLLGGLQALGLLGDGHQVASRQPG